MIASNRAAANEIRELFQEEAPRRIIETGTHLGLGSTLILATAVRDFAPNAIFYSIECNPEFHAEAVRHLNERNLLRYVRLLNGLSIPRELLPSTRDISGLVQTAIEKHVQMDGQGSGYEEETTCPPYLPDRLLGRTLEDFGFVADFILLDSAGHTGYIEFRYMLNMLKGPCWIALDDAKGHIKHYQSVEVVREDPRFRVVYEDSEECGFIIARFDPLYC